MSDKVRLDSLLASRGLFESRTRAAASVIAGEVMVGEERRKITKPGQLVSSEIGLVVAERQRFVSRGGTKLANGLRSLGLDVSGRLALDAGASTGGFTDCLLQSGAEAVIAVDVAYGELSWRIREDPRVVVMERTNARHLTAAMLPWQPDLLVCDLSFIGLGKVLPVLRACMTDRFDAVALIKPQFEVGRARVGSGGVVRDPDLRRTALIEVAVQACESGFSIMGFASSGLPGPKGNVETFVHLAEAGRGSGAEAIERLLAEVEW